MTDKKRWKKTMHLPATDFGGSVRTYTPGPPELVINTRRGPLGRDCLASISAQSKKIFVVADPGDPGPPEGGIVDPVFPGQGTGVGSGGPGTDTATEAGSNIFSKW